MANEVVEQERVEVTHAARTDGARVVMAREVMTRLAPTKPDPLHYFAKEPWGVKLVALCVMRFPWKSALFVLAAVYGGIKLP